MTLASCCIAWKYNLQDELVGHMCPKSPHLIPNSGFSRRAVQQTTLGRWLAKALTGIATALMLSHFRCSSTGAHNSERVNGAFAKGVASCWHSLSGSRGFWPPLLRPVERWSHSKVLHRMWVLKAVQRAPNETTLRTAAAWLRAQSCYEAARWHFSYFESFAPCSIRSGCLWSALARQQQVHVFQCSCERRCLQRQACMQPSLP